MNREKSYVLVDRRCGATRQPSKATVVLQGSLRKNVGGKISQDCILGFLISCRCAENGRYCWNPR